MEKDLWIIVNWTYGDFSSINFVTDEDGNTMRFHTEEEAQEFINTELNGYNKVINLEP